MKNPITLGLILLPSLFFAPAAHAGDFAAKPCSLISDKTASTVLHQAMAVAPAELAHTSGQCEWTSGGKSLVALAETPQGLTLRVNVEQDGSFGWQRDSEALDKPEQNGTPLTGLGDRAIWVPHSFLGSYMLVQKGGTIVDIQVTASDVSRKDPVTRAQMQTLAREVLTHL
jgi:hypothetical protein